MILLLNRLNDYIKFKGNNNKFIQKYQEDMPKLESWSDLFKFNKELLDDDYNPGQAFVAKTKNKSTDGTTVLLFHISTQSKISLMHLGVLNYIQAS
jgi:hypothetical protein